MNEENEEFVLSDMCEHFLITALWSTSDYCEGDENENDNLDKRYTVDDISENFKRDSQKLCDDFMNAAREYFTSEELENETTIGHDLWLTIAGHGAGFWDGDYEQGDKLTEIAKSLSSDLSDELNEDIVRENTDKHNEKS